MKQSIIEKYRKEFPVSEIPSLYPYQERAITNLLIGKNSLTIVPTGGGKSIVYQLAGLEMEGTVLVISPLKALMQEQVNELNSKSIKAIALTSDIGFQEQRSVLRKLGKLNFKFIYVSPERLQNYFFRAALIHSSNKISMVVIDEAHCISQWGFDFRPEYAMIKGFLNFVNGNGHSPIVLALSATLSVKAIDDIRQEFSIVEKTIFDHKSLIRSELKLNFIKTTDKKSAPEKWSHLLDFLKSRKSKKAIIYFYSKLKCEELAKKFNVENAIEGLVADYFHSGIGESEKQNKYDAFKKGEINILFATTAFGMGMNIPDIDTIIQYHLPKSIEEYYQQIGRGARNKNLCKECNCLLFWSEKNFKSNIQEIENERCTDEKIKKAIEYLSLSGKANKVSSINYSELQNAKINLPKFLFYFEKLGVIERVGEVNGGPNSIRFKKSTPMWLEVQNAAIGNSFIIASIRLKKSIQELINYVFDQDLLENVEFLPAMDKKLFIKELTDGLKPEQFEYIKNDISEKVNYQLNRFDALQGLCRSYSPEKYLEKVFNNLLDV